MLRVMVFVNRVRQFGRIEEEVIWLRTGTGGGLALVSVVINLRVP